MGRKKPKLSDRELAVYLSEIGSRGGKMTAKKMTAEQRSENARRAATERWRKAKEK